MGMVSETAKKRSFFSTGSYGEITLVKNSERSGAEAEPSDQDEVRPDFNRHKRIRKAKIDAGQLGKERADPSNKS